MRTPPASATLPAPTRAARPRRGPRLAALCLALAAAATLLAWRSEGFWNALSPISDKAQLYRLSGEIKVDPLLLAAIVRAESGFDPIARSPRGAVGLMQLMPATARQVARELKFDYQDGDDLYTGDINLTLGAHYFARQLKDFHGDLPLALAAYNAGPAKVRSWGLDPWGQDQDLLISRIPLPATRAYVRRVLWYYRLFARMRRVKRFLRGEPEP